VGRSQIRIIDSNGEITTFDAVATGDPGGYVANITFPESGTWRWEVTQGDFAPHDMGTIEVTAASNLVTSGRPRLPWLLLSGLAVSIGLLASRTMNLVRARRPQQPTVVD
jgi:hypothetical protein